MRSRCRSRTLVAALVLLPASPSLSRTWQILPDGSGDAPTIQAGVDSAAAGDTVLVACGTHCEHDIILKGRVYLHGESSSTACAVIDAARQGSVLRCEGLSNRCYIKGIVLTGGMARYGGGLHCEYSYGPEIRDCVLTDNVLTDNQ